MTEEEWINVKNLQMLRVAQWALREIVVTDKSGIDGNKLAETLEWVYSEGERIYLHMERLT